MSAGTEETDRYEPAHGSRSIHVEHYDLDLTYRVVPNVLAGVATLSVRTREEVREIALDLAGLAVEKVAVRGAVLTRYRHRGDKLVLRFAEEVGDGALLEISVRYGGRPVPVRSPWGPVGWEELEEGVLVASQPTGAPSWFPCNDRPGDKATYRTSLTVDRPFFVLAHGELVARKERSSATTWVYEERHPTATYLATVQVGNYESVALGQQPVPQRVVVPAVHRAAAQRLLARHGELMAYFTEVFGPYPFAEYTLVVTADRLEIPVEAQGMSVFGSNHLSDDDGARLVPHELAHQWFGNSLTVDSWRHIWLNEGFASYAEWLWSEHSGGDSADTLARTWHRRLGGAGQDLVVSDPGPERIFDDLIYKRGALTLHALRRTLGDEAFFELLRAWTGRHRYGTVTTGQFRALAAHRAELAGGPALADRVDAVLTAWLDRPRLPALPGS